MTEYKKVFCPRHELRKDLVISYISPSSVLRSEFLFISCMLNLELAAVLSEDISINVFRIALLLFCFSN